MNAEFRELAGKVAAELGWLLDTTWDAYGEQITGYGMAIHLGEPYKGKTEIGGAYPHSNYGFPRGTRNRIGVSVARGPEAIAREIKRRLLPEVIANFAKIRAYDKAEAADTAAREALTARILALFPDGAVHLPGHCQTDYGTQLVIRLSERALDGGWVKFHGDGTEVEFERFRVSGEAAVAMLAVAAAVAAGRLF